MLRLLGNRVFAAKGGSSFWGGWKAATARDEERGAGGSSSNRIYAAAAAAHQDAANDLTQAIQRSKEAVYQLDKRQQHVERRIKHQEAAARQSVAAGDKRGALLCLRRKKLFEDDLQQLLTSRMALETQIVSLEAAHTQQLAVQAMAGAAKAHRSFSQKLSLGRIDKLLDDIQEQQDAQQEVTQVLAQNVPLLDDDELQQELQQIEAEEMEERVYRLACSIPSVPADNSADSAVAEMCASLALQESLCPQQQQAEPRQQQLLLGYQPAGAAAPARTADATRNESGRSAAAATATAAGAKAAVGDEGRVASLVLCGEGDTLSPRSSSQASVSTRTSSRSTRGSTSYSTSSSSSGLPTTGDEATAAAAPADHHFPQAMSFIRLESRGAATAAAREALAASDVASASCFFSSGASAATRPACTTARKNQEEEAVILCKASTRGGTERRGPAAAVGSIPPADTRGACVGRTEENSGRTLTQQRFLHQHQQQEEFTDDEQFRILLRELARY